MTSSTTIQHFKGLVVISATPELVELGCVRKRTEITIRGFLWQLMGAYAERLAAKH